MFVFTHAPLQSDVPAEHTHAPPEHTCPDAHLRPQPPQFEASELRSTQLAPQAVRPPVHTTEHTPPTHDCPERHARPHPPQCALSVAVFTHDPLQSVPETHAHAPPEHT